MDISADDLLYEAWAVIANAGWDGADKSEGWQEAAVRWRDRWHAYLDETTDVLDEGGRLERVVLCEHGFDESHRVFTDARGMERCAKGSRTVVWPPKEDE